MFIKCNLIISTLLFVTCSALEFRDCGNGQVKGLKVDACPPDQESCVLTKGKPFNVEMEMIAEHDAEAVTFHLSTLVFGFPVELPVKNNNACEEKLIECPVKAGVPTKFIYTGQVDESVPVSSATVVFNLKSGDTEIACVEADLELQDPLPAEDDDSKESDPKYHQEL